MLATRRLLLLTRVTFTLIALVFSFNQICHQILIGLAIDHKLLLRRLGYLIATFRSGNASFGRFSDHIKVLRSNIVLLLLL